MNKMLTAALIAMTAAASIATAQNARINAMGNSYLIDDIANTISQPGFMNDHRDDRIPVAFALMGAVMGGAEYHEPSAVDARARIVAFFDRHLR